MWTSIDDWLLQELLECLDEDDVYRLWVFALENSLDGVHREIEISFPLSHSRASHLAMAYGCWTAVLVLSGAPTNARLTKQTLNYIDHEIQRHVTPVRRYRDRARAMSTAATPGSIPPFVMYFAVKQGNAESVIWLHHVTEYDPSEALRIAARHDHRVIVSWLLQNAAKANWTSPECSIHTVFSDQDDPELGVFAWQVRYHDEVVDSTVYSTKWGFADIGASGLTEYQAIDLAATNGDVAGVQRLFSHPVFADAYTPMGIEDTARAGHLHVLDWLYEHRREVFHHTNTLHVAAISGQLAVAQWAAARDIEGKVHDVTFDHVVRNGHLHVLRWLTETFPTSAALHVDELLLGRACFRGYTDIVKWFVEEEGYKATPRLQFHAAGSGNFELFQWILLQFEVASGYELTPVLLKPAARSGSLELVRWLVEDRGLWSPEAAFEGAAKSKTIDILDYLYGIALARGEGVPDPEAMNYPATIDEGDFDTLTWLLEHGMTRSHFNKKGFDCLKMIETSFALVNEQLGWSDYTREHNYWPRTHATMKRFRQLLSLIIDVYDAEFLRSITWLPEWAVQHGTLRNLERLAAVEHPHVQSPKVFRRLLRISTDAKKVRWFLTTVPDRFSTRVVKWGVRYDKRRFLTWLFREFLPVHQAANGSDANLHYRCVQSLMWRAGKAGREDLLALMLEATSI